MLCFLFVGIVRCGAVGARVWEVTSSVSSNH